MEEKFLTTKQVADILGVHANTVRSMAIEGRIKSSKTKGASGRLRFRLEDINDFMKSDWKSVKTPPKLMEMRTILAAYDKEPDRIVPHHEAMYWLSTLINREKTFVGMFDLSMELYLEATGLDVLLSPEAQEAKPDKDTVRKESDVEKENSMRRVDELIEILEEELAKGEDIPFADAREWLEEAIRTEESLHKISELLEQVRLKAQELRAKL